MKWGSFDALACFRYLLFLAVFAGHQAVGEEAIVINEIMYHVKETEWKENQGAEFVELYHSGDEPISLESWRFSSGISFTFPPVVMQPDDYLIIAADVDAFRERHPGVEQVLGPFRGRLSNSGETLELEDADEAVVDRVEYADSGRWAKRVSARLQGYDDWVWQAPHDGEGYSLSLISPRADNQYGAYWAPSMAEGGTPGAKNDVFQEAVPPVVVSLAHHPAIPKSTDSVEVQAEFAHSSAVVMTLHYRQDGETDFQAVPMKEGRGTIPLMADKTVVQFYVHVEDEAGLESGYPELQVDAKGRPAKRQALCLYQVDDEFDQELARTPGSKPTYRVITTADEIALIRQLSGISGAGREYDNRLHCTFISVDGLETQVRYQVTARIRGHGSRSQFPPGLRVSFPSDDPWGGVTAINLNSQYTQSQSLGAAIYQIAGFAAARATPVHLRMNGEDWTREGSPQYGCYVHNEVLDDVYLEAHFPGEEDGNLYRLIGNANLDPRGSDLSNYRGPYDKRNNSSEDDYADILHVIETLAAVEPAATYFERVNEVIDLEQWSRYIAFDALLANIEGGMPTGRGDDVAIFRRKDGRFHLIPYDLDSILGMGDREPQLEKSIFDYGNMQGLRRLFQDERFLELYTSQFIKLTETVYRPEIIHRLIDDLWQGWIPQDEIEEVKDFFRQRVDFVLGQIQSSSTVIGSTLEKENGFHKASSSRFALYGRFDRGAVHEVLVGGIEPKLFKQTGTWVMPPDRLSELVRPGMNQIPIVMRDTGGQVVQREIMRVWLDNGVVESVRGSLPAGQTIRWTPDQGPYLLEEEIMVPVESTLVIEAGTTVYGATQGGLLVEGNLEVNGEADQRVTFAKDPARPEITGWAGIRFSGSHAGEAVIAHADLLDIAAPIELAGRKVRFEGTTVHWVGNHGLQGVQAELTINGSELRQSGAEGGPVIGLQKGSLSLMRSRIAKESGGPSVSLEDMEKYDVFANHFEQPGTPVLESGGAGFVDGNDFSITAKSAAPVVVPGDNIVLSRNRVFGQAALGVAEATDGNTHHSRAQAPRTLAMADVVFLKQPPPKTPDTTLRLEIGGHGLAAFCYQVDSQGWSDPMEMDGRDRREFILEVTPGRHQLRLKGQHVSGRWQTEDEATLSREFEVVPGLPSVEISELLAVNEETHQINGGYADYIELHNFSERPFDLSGFSLSDDPENLDQYVFPPDTVMEPHSYLLLAADKDTLGFALNREGESVILSDREGKVTDQVTFGLQVADHSISRLEEGVWGLSVPTPGAANEAAGLAAAESLGFTEWLAVPSVRAPDEFLELFNSGDQPVAVGGFVITDRVPNERQWHRLPPLSYIGAKQYQVFITDGDATQGNVHLDFRLANEGEVVGLLSPQGELIDYCVFGPQSPGVSQGRRDNGALYYGPPSPGEADVETVRPGSVDAIYGIRISEIHYHPAANEDEEFIELINIGAGPVELEGLEFTDGIEFVFESSRLEPGARVILVKDRRVFQRRYGLSVPIAGEYEGRLSNAGERLRLVTARGETVVEFEYSDNWYRATDGRGYSLTLVDPQAPRIDTKEAWQVSNELGGTPGY